MQSYFSACGFPIFLTQFIEETILVPLYIPGPMLSINLLYICGFIVGLSILFKEDSEKLSFILSKV